MKNSKTMDEVWEDVNLATLSDLTDENLSTTLSLHTNNQNSHHTSNLTAQDFFSGPIDRDSSQTRISSPHFISPIPQLMSLNSTACGFDFLVSHDSTVAGHGSHFQNHNGSNVHCLNSNGSHVGMGSVSDASSSNGQRRVQEYGRNLSYRQLRMIQTREAAARSRARKKARVAALERARVELREANAYFRGRVMNKEQQRAAAAKLPEKRPLFRRYTV